VLIKIYNHRIIYGYNTYDNKYNIPGKTGIFTLNDSQLKSLIINSNSLKIEID